MRYYPELLSPQYSNRKRSQRAIEAPKTFVELSRGDTSAQLRNSYPTASFPNPFSGVTSHRLYCYCCVECNRFTYRWRWYLSALCRLNGFGALCAKRRPAGVASSSFRRGRKYLVNGTLPKVYCCCVHLLFLTSGVGLSQILGARLGGCDREGRVCFERRRNTLQK